MWWREDVERGLQMWGLEGPCSPLPLPRDNKDSTPSGNSAACQRGQTCAPPPGSARGSGGGGGDWGRRPACWRRVRRPGRELSPVSRVEITQKVLKKRGGKLRPTGGKEAAEASCGHAARGHVRLLRASLPAPPAGSGSAHLLGRTRWWEQRPGSGCAPRGGLPVGARQAVSILSLQGQGQEDRVGAGAA